MTVRDHIADGEFVASRFDLDTPFGRIEAFDRFRVVNGFLAEIRPYYDPRPDHLGDGGESGVKRELTAAGRVELTASGRESRVHPLKASTRLRCWTRRRKADAHHDARGPQETRIGVANQSSHDAVDSGATLADVGAFVPWNLYSVCGHGRRRLRQRHRRRHRDRFIWRGRGLRHPQVRQRRHVGLGHPARLRGLRSGGGDRRRCPGEYLRDGDWQHVQ